MAFPQGEANIWYFGYNAGIKFNTDGSVTALTNGQLYDPDGGGVGGVTGASTIKGKTSIIYISPSSKGDYFGKVNGAKMTIVHELLHGYHLFKNLPNYNRYSENAASTYTYAYLTAYGSRNGASFYYPNVRPYPANFSWRNLPSIINTGLK